MDGFMVNSSGLQQVCVHGLTDLHQILDQLSKSEKNNGWKQNKTKKSDVVFQWPIMKKGRLELY